MYVNHAMKATLLVGITIMSLIILLFIIWLSFRQPSVTNNEQNINDPGDIRFLIKERFQNPVAFNDDDVTFATSSSYDEIQYTTNDRQYFVEVDIKQVIEALDASINASLDQDWQKLVIIKKVPTEQDYESVKSMLHNILNKNINIYDVSKGDTVTFELKGLKHLESKAISYDKIPYYYTKWDVIIHRDSKVHGFNCQIVIMHLSDKLYLCHHDNHTIIHEDIIANTTELPYHMYASSSSSFSAFSPR